MSLSAYILDDEPLAVDRLRRLIEESSRQVSVLGSSMNPAEALPFLRSHQVDVLFLDISMPGMTGFELLAKLSEPPHVVFTTAYDQYAVKAFEVNSVDYLLKPVDFQQLDRALGRVERLRGSGGQAIDVQKLIDGLASTLRKGVPAYPDRIASRLGDRISFIELATVTHIYADDKLTYAVADGKAYCLDQTITDLEQRLDPKRFVRIHRATLINCDFVKEMVSLPGGTLMVRLKDAKHTELAVARNRNQQVKGRLGL